MDKTIQYAAMLQSKIGELFEPDNDSGFNPADLEDDENATAFIHALATMMPNRIYNRLTGDNKNNLEFNHIANQLVFQFSKKQ